MRDQAILLIVLTSIAFCLDLQRNTGQIFKQHVEVAHYNSQKGKDTPTMNASAAGCTAAADGQISPIS